MAGGAGLHMACAGLPDPDLLPENDKNDDSLSDINHISEISDTDTDSNIKWDPVMPALSAPLSDLTDFFSSPGRCIGVVSVYMQYNCVYYCASSYLRISSPPQLRHCW
jgi:predicted DNA-binding helix-hairpin-helix protein